MMVFSYSLLPGEGYCNSSQLKDRNAFNISIIEFNKDLTLAFVNGIDFLFADCTYKWELENTQKTPIDWTTEVRKGFGEDVAKTFIGFKPVPWNAKTVINRIKRTMEYILGKSHIGTCGYLRETANEIIPDHVKDRRRNFGVFVILLLMGLFLVVGIFKAITGSSRIYPTQ